MPSQTKDEMEINADTIRKVVEHHYFQAQVEQQVRTRTEAYINRWWKIIAAFASVIVIVTGAFGYHQLSDLQKQFAEQHQQAMDKLKEARELTDEAKNRLTQVKAQQEEAKAEAREAQSSVGAAKSAAETSRQITTEWVSAIAARQGDLAAKQSEIDKTQAQLDKESDRLARRLKRIRKAQQTANNAANNAEHAADTAEQNSKRTNNLVKNTSDLVEGLKDKESFQEQINKAAASETVLIRSKHSTTVALTDFRFFKGKTQQPRYDITFYVPSIKDEVKINVAVNGHNALDAKWLPQQDGCHIPGTPFMFRVYSIYHAKLAFDFVVLRVIPDEGTDINAGCGKPQASRNSNSAPNSKSDQPRAGQGSTAGTSMSLSSKFEYFRKSSLGTGTLLLPALSAALRQVNPPSRYPAKWRVGGGGFSRNYADYLARGTAAKSARFLTGALLREDPRYFPSTNKEPLRRFLHAIFFTFVDRSDSGRSRIALSNFAAAAAGGFAGNAYLPDGYNDVSHAGARSAVGLAGLSAHNLYEEFKPDIKRLLRMARHRIHL